MRIMGSAGMRRATLATLLTVAGIAGATPAHAVSPTPSQKVTLDVNTVNGSGCKPGTANATMLDDNTAFRIRYHDFIARDGGDAGPTEFRQNCQVNVAVHIPQGFTFAIARADYRGRANLHADAMALHRTSYYIQGRSETVVRNHTLTGPHHGTWASTDIHATAELVWAPCGVTRNININTELRVYSPKSFSWISMRASEGDVDTLLHFSWKRC